MNEAVKNQELRDKIAQDYEWGFSSDIEQEFAPKGLSEDTVRFISAKKDEPEWMLDWRLKAYRAWLEMEEVSWAKLDIPAIDYQDAYYYAAPKPKPKLGSLDEVDPEILRVYEKLGIPIEEQKVLAGVEGARKVAVDAVFDSVSVATTFREELKKAGVIFLSISEAIREYPELVKKYLGSVVPQRDNYFACLNSAVFSDGTFVYVPEGVRCPMELSTYFRINAENTGQFERTMMIHIGANTRSTIVSKGISAGRSNNTYRGLVRVLPRAENVRNFTQCDSLLLGSDCGAHTVPYIEVKNPSATIEHEATTSKISEDQLFYAMSRGLDAESAVSLIVNGFAREVLKQLPMEFAVEAQKLLGISLEGSVG